MTDALLREGMLQFPLQLRRLVGTQPSRAPLKKSRQSLLCDLLSTWDCRGEWASLLTLYSHKDLFPCTGNFLYSAF